MKQQKTVLILLLSITMISISCKKDGSPETTSAQNDFLEIVVGGKTYKNEIFSQGTGFTNQSGCIPNKPHFLAFISEIENSEFRFTGYISHLENEVDFIKYNAGKYYIQSGFGLICNLNLSLAYKDKLSVNQTTTLVAGGTNQVTSITKKSTTSTSTKYQIQGNFTCSFKNSTGKNIPITTGNYQYTAEVYK